MLVVVKVTELPLHAFKVEGLIDNVGVKEGVTATVTGAEITIAFEGHNALDVNWHETISPFPNVVGVNDMPVWLLMIPFTFQINVGTDPPFVIWAVNVWLVPKHILATLGVIAILGFTVVLTTIVITFDITGLVFIQAPLAVSWHETTLLFWIAELLKTLLLPDAAVPLTNHWYWGLDPLLILVAVYVTELPLHIFVALAEIDILGIKVADTFIVIAFEVILLAVTQLAFEVITQVTISPFDKLEDVNIVEFVPILFPFIFHWYCGLEPPLVLVAVKVTELPLQIKLLVAEIVIVGGTLFELNVINTTLDVSDIPFEHCKLEYIIQ